MRITVPVPSWFFFPRPRWVCYSSADCLSPEHSRATLCRPINKRHCFPRKAVERFNQIHTCKAPTWSQTGMWRSQFSAPSLQNMGHDKNSKVDYFCSVREFFWHLFKLLQTRVAIISPSPLPQNCCHFFIFQPSVTVHKTSCVTGYSVIISAL